MIITIINLRYLAASSIGFYNDTNIVNSTLNDGLYTNNQSFIYDNYDKLSGSGVQNAIKEAEIKFSDTRSYDKNIDFNIKNFYSKLLKKDQFCRELDKDDYTSILYTIYNNDGYKEETKSNNFNRLEYPLFKKSLLRDYGMFEFFDIFLKRSIACFSGSIKNQTIEKARLEVNLDKPNSILISFNENTSGKYEKIFKVKTETHVKSEEFYIPRYILNLRYSEPNTENPEILDQKPEKICYCKLTIKVKDYKYFLNKNNHYVNCFDRENTLIDDDSGNVDAALKLEMYKEKFKITIRYNYKEKMKNSLFGQNTLMDNMTIMKFEFTELNYFDNLANEDYREMYEEYDEEGGITFEIKNRTEIDGYVILDILSNECKPLEIFNDNENRLENQNHEQIGNILSENSTRNEDNPIFVPNPNFEKYNEDLTNNFSEKNEDYDSEYKYNPDKNNLSHIESKVLV